MNITLRLVNDALQFSQNGTTINPGMQGDIDISPGNTARYGGNVVAVSGSFTAGRGYELCGDSAPEKNKKFFDIRTGQEVGHLA